MKQVAIIICASLLFVINCGGSEVRSKIQQEVKNSAERATQQQGEFSQSMAISLAQEEASKSYGALVEYDAKACETAEEWYIIFDPKSQSYNGGIIEYVIAKHGGTILKTRKILPVNTIGDEPEERKSSAHTEVKREEAIRISYRDAATAYKSPERYNVTACELTRAWLIIYELKNTDSVGGGPEYFIDKTTGNILDKRYYQ